MKLFWKKYKEVIPCNTGGVLSFFLLLGLGALSFFFFSFDIALADHGEPHPEDELSAWESVGLSIFNVGAFFFFKIAGLVLSVGAWLLDASITYTLDTSNISLGAIEDAWTAVRDLSNIIFVFILVYISIQTILQVGNFETKKILTSLVIVALLVNFSLFFTKIVIDASNIFAASFYNQITIEGEGGVATTLMNGLGLQTMFDGSGLSLLGGHRTFVLYVFGGILSLIAAFSFGSAAIMFVIRSVALMFLMVLSPLAFVARILPGTKKYYDDWWNTLLKYSFYAPAYILLIALTVAVITKGGAWNAVEKGGSFGAVIEGWYSGAVDLSYMDIFFQFAMVVGLVYGSYLLAKQFGLYGAETVMKGAKAATGALAFGATGFALRQTAGRAASIAASGEKLKDAAKEGGVKGFAARAALRTSRAVATRSFDARGVKVAGKGIPGMGKAAEKGGFEAGFEKRVKRQTEFAKSIGADRDKQSLENVLKTPFGYLTRGNAVASAQLQLKIKEKAEKELQDKIKENNKKLDDLEIKKTAGTLAPSESSDMEARLAQRDALEKKKEKLEEEMKPLRAQGSTIKTKPDKKDDKKEGEEKESDA